MALFSGTNANDILSGTEDVDQIFGGDGDDVLGGVGGSDALYGEAGQDTLIGGDGNDSLDGGSGNDFLYGGTDIGSGNDTLIGGVGDDFFYDPDGVNVLDGGDGNDTFLVSVSAGGANTVTGGAGGDVYVFDPASPSLADGTSSQTYVVTDFEVGGGGDQLVLLSLLDSASGYTGGDPRALGFLNFVQAGADTRVEWDRDGAAGSAYGSVLIATLLNVTASDITANNLPGLDLPHDIFGTDDDDELIGELGDDSIFGGGGDDTLLGGGGNDTLNGGSGADRMEGGPGNDTYLVDVVGDQVIETSNVPEDNGIETAEFQDALQGITDTVIAAVNYSLTAFVENLTLDGTAAAGTGNELNNELTGNELNNTLTGLAGNDTLDGGAGLDTAVFSGDRSSYTISGAGASVSGPDGSDTLSNIERLQFANASLAFDLDRGESAGNSVRLIGAAFGTSFLTPEVIGVVVDIFDSGLTLSQVCAAALPVMGSPGNAAFVGMIFQNVAEIDPPPDAQAALVGLLDSGAMTQAQMLEIVVNLDLNETHIGLVGMQQNGVEFV